MTQKIKYIFFGYADYMKIAISDILSRNDVVYYHFKADSLLKKIIYKIVATDIISKYIKQFFYPFFYKKKWIDKEEMPIFIFYECSILACDKNFLLHLRTKYPICKIVFIFTNISTYNKDIIKFITTNKFLYNIVFTFNEEDANKYNFTFYEQCMSPNSYLNSNIKYDLYFCGLDKGRKYLLNSIQKRMEQYGIKCKFRIYNSLQINYNQILNEISQSKCVLEVLHNNLSMGSTLRFAEAIAYKKKLLTNNQAIINKRLYNPEQMSIFSCADDIDINFIKQTSDTSKFNNPNSVSPKLFLIFLEKHILNS